VLPFRKWVIVIQQLQYKKSSDKLHHYSGIDRRILSPPTTEKQDKMPINTIEAAEREQRITALSPSGSGVPYSGWIVFAPAGLAPAGAMSDGQNRLLPTPIFFRDGVGGRRFFWLSIIIPRGQAPW
jgi:hypothetical protein